MPRVVGERGLQTPARAVGAPAPARIPRGAEPDGDGIRLGGGAVRVDVYIDFLCPFCKQFHDRTGATIDRLVAGDGLQNGVRG